MVKFPDPPIPGLQLLAVRATNVATLLATMGLA